MRAKIPRVQPLGRVGGSRQTGQLDLYMARRSRVVVRPISLPVHRNSLRYVYLVHGSPLLIRLDYSSFTSGSRCRSRQRWTSLRQYAQALAVQDPGKVERREVNRYFRAAGLDSAHDAFPSSAADASARLQVIHASHPNRLRGLGRAQKWRPILFQLSQRTMTRPLLWPSTTPVSQPVMFFSVTFAPTGKAFAACRVLLIPAVPHLPWLLQQPPWIV